MPSLIQCMNEARHKTSRSGTAYLMRQSHYMKKNGFTLIEILVVLVIIGLMGSLVFINVGRTAKDREGKDFAKEFVLMLKKARREAISSGEPKAVNMASASRKCYMDGDEKKVNIPEDMRIEGEGIGKRIMSESDPESEEDIYAVYFYPDGSSGGGDITLSILENEIATLRIDALTGYITKVKSDENNRQ